MFKCFIGLNKQELNLIVSRQITNKQKGEAKEKIIFQSPFYKKRNKIEAKFRNFSKIITAEEIEKYSSEIWREAHSGLIS